MSRILKRPMFRTGGTPNEGIMHGLVDRKGFYQGSIDPKRTRADVQTELDILKEYAPMPKSRFPMGQIGLNLVSGEYAGDGLLSNIAGSAKGPYSEWTARDDLREQALMQRRAGAAGRSITQQRAEYAAKLKAAGQSPYLKDTSPQRAYETFLTKNLESKAKLEKWEKPPLNVKHPRGVAYYDSFVTRNLRTTASPQGKEIAANSAGFVPFEIDTQEFDYSAMIPGMYYYDPRGLGRFVQRVPDDPDTPENEGGYFQYHRDTFAKSKIQGTE